MYVYILSRVSIKTQAYRNIALRVTTSYSQVDPHEPLINVSSY